MDSSFSMDKARIHCQTREMAMMRDDLVIEASNCWNAIIGFKENIAIAKPEAKRTHRVS